MKSAFVLINSEPEFNQETLADIKKIEGVSEAYPSHGSYDIVARVNAESIDKLTQIIFHRIKGVATIKSTLTMMVVDETK